VDGWIGFALRGAGAEGLNPATLAQRTPFAPAEAQRTIEGALQRREAVKAGGRIVGRHAYERALERSREALERFHADQPERAGVKRDALRDASVGTAGGPLFDAILGRLVKEGEWRVEGDLVARADHRPGSASGVTLLADRALAHVGRRPEAPPGLRDLAGALEVDARELARAVDLLVASGRARLLDGEFLYPVAFLETLAAGVRGFLSRTDRLMVTDLKDIAGVTRKHALPLARWLDDAGVTVRRGEYRVLKR
jgi:selenocysteine-specific elongation factor